MKTLSIVLLIIILLVVGSGIFYFSIQKDKCSKVVCSSDQQCHPSTGVCESKSDVLNKIETSINEELNKPSETFTNPMDKIENAIEEALG